MAKMRYCDHCKEWVEADSLCPKCKSETFETRRVTDPEEVRKYVTVRPEYKDVEAGIIQMIAESGVLIESRSGAKEFAD